MSAHPMSRRNAKLNTLAMTAGALLPVSALLAGCKTPELVCTDTGGLSPDERASGGSGSGMTWLPEKGMELIDLPRG